jgi:hypothetical protein
MKQMMIILLLTATAGSGAFSQPVVMMNGPASATVTLSVIIPATAKIMSASPIAPIAITAVDIRNGSKDIPSAVELTIWSNARDGFVLQSRLVSLKAWNGSAAAGILVLGKAAGTSDLQPQGTDYQDLCRGNKPEKNLRGLSVDLKLLINPGTKPGLYQLEPEFSVRCL